MRDIETLDQIGLTGTYAPIRTSKLQKKPEFRGSILSGLMDFATALSFRIGLAIQKCCYFIASIQEGDFLARV